MTRRFRTVLLVVVALAAVTGFVRALALPADRGPPGDFLRYGRAATLVWRGEGELLYDTGARARSAVWGDPVRLPEKRYRYAPGLAVVLAPLGALAPATAWTLWSALCAALVAAGAGLAVALALRRLPEAGPAWLPLAAAVVPLVHLYTENVKLGQMNCLAFALSVGALWALDRGRDRAAGLLAAGAALAKHIPVLLVLWFLWKRRWRAAGWGLAGLGLLFYAVPTAALGPAAHHDLLGQWAAQEDKLVTEVDEPDGMEATVNAVHVEGQSLKALLYRYLTPTAFFHLRELTPPPPPLPGEGPRLRPAGAGAHGILVNGGRTWEPRTVFRLWLASLFVAMAVVVLATGPRPGEDPAAAARRFPLEGGLVLALLLLVSPESRNPHFQMLAPALAALAAGLAGRSGRGAAWWTVAAAGGLGALLVGISTSGVLGRSLADHFLARGTIGFGGILLFGAAALALFRERAASPVPEAP